MPTIEKSERREQQKKSIRRRRQIIAQAKEEAKAIPKATSKSLRKRARRLNELTSKRNSITRSGLDLPDDLVNEINKTTQSVMRKDIRYRYVCSICGVFLPVSGHKKCKSDRELDFAIARELFKFTIVDTTDDLGSWQYRTERYWPRMAATYAPSEVPHYSTNKLDSRAVVQALKAKTGTDLSRLRNPKKICQTALAVIRLMSL